MIEKISTLEKAVEVFPEIKDFVDYVKQTNGQQTLQVENGVFRYLYNRDPEHNEFYRAELTLDRAHPKMWLFFREGMTGTAPFAEPAPGGVGLLQWLPEIFDTLKKVHEICFVHGKYFYS